MKHTLWMFVLFCVLFLVSFQTLALFYPPKKQVLSLYPVFPFHTPNNTICFLHRMHTQMLYVAGVFDFTFIFTHVIESRYFLIYSNSVRSRKTLSLFVLPYIIIIIDWNNVVVVVIVVYVINELNGIVAPPHWIELTLPTREKNCMELPTRSISFVFVCVCLNALHIDKIMKSVAKKKKEFMCASLRQTNDRKKISVDKDKFHSELNENNPPKQCVSFLRAWMALRRFFFVFTLCSFILSQYY